jgi:hypothetical protein
MTDHAQPAKNPDRTTPERRNRAVVADLAQSAAQERIGLAPIQAALKDPTGVTPSAALALQRVVGNRVTRAVIQPRLVVGPAGDRYEQEADHVANQVMTMPAPSVRASVQRQAEEEEEIQTSSLLQRQAEEEEEIQTSPLLQRQAEEEEEIQTSRLDRSSWVGGGFEVGDGMEGRLTSLRGQGDPLSADVRAFMEPRFGADFGGVRIHTGGESDQMNRSLNAQAFTHGQDIYMGAGRFDPGSSGGRQLLAHELTHVIQQTGSARLRRRSDGIGVSVKSAVPSGTLNRKLKYLDFVVMKRKETHIAKMLLHKLKLAKEPDDAYGHWWTEIGDLIGANWVPTESYGWWPAVGVNIWSTLKGVLGSLNRGGGNQDPHHGDADAASFHPVMDVPVGDTYQDVRNRVTAAIRNFATGFKGKWKWRLGWGKNCHTFQERLMKAVGLKKGKADEWLKAPEPTGEALLKGIFSPSELDLLRAGGDLDMVLNASMSPGTFVEDMQRLKPNQLAALATLMGISLENLNQQIGALR